MKVNIITACIVTLMLVACADAPVKRYALTAVKGERIEVTNAFDEKIPNDVSSLIAPYRAAVDSLMCPVLGESAVCMVAERPESPLSNWIADVLVDIAERNGFNVDLALSNIGGMRSAMPKGDVTVGDVMAIAPFENRLCVLTLKGDDLLDLFRQIAQVGGEGLSASVRMTMTSDRELVDVAVDGKKINSNKTYSIATIDYLAEGNDGMKALKNAVKREDTKLLMREMLMDYIKRQTAEGKTLNSKIEGRVMIDNN